MKSLFRFMVIIVWIGLLVIVFVSFANKETFVDTAADKNFKTEVLDSSGNTQDIPVLNTSEPKVYSIDKNNSKLMVRLYKEGFFSGFAHDHIVIAKEFSGLVEFDEIDPTRFKIAVEVPANSVAADLPEMRRKYGLDELSQKDWIEINKTMRSRRQLDIEKYPAIKFNSSDLNKTETGFYEISGEFSLHGVTKIIVVPVTISVENGILKLQGEFAFLQSDYNIKPFSSALGTVRNKDEVLMKFDIFAIKK